MTRNPDGSVTLEPGERWNYLPGSWVEATSDRSAVLDPELVARLDETAKVNAARRVNVDRGSDARAQLWREVYRDVLAAARAGFREQPPPGLREHPLRSDVMAALQQQSDAARQYARDAANAAVRDFDEHYIGGKR